LPESAASALDAKPWAHEAAQRALTDHFRRTGGRAEVLPGAAAGSFRIRYQIAGSPLVSIIIPARAPDSATPLESCLRSLAKTGYSRFEIIVVSDFHDLPGWVRQLPIAERVRWHAYGPAGRFNLPDRIASGAAVARGE